MAETISTNQFKNGMHVELDGQVWRIVEFQHVKPGKGGAFVRTKLKNAETGAVVDRTFRAGEKMPRVHTETKSVQYLYDSGDEVVFMDAESYEQISFPRAEVEQQLEFLLPSSSLMLLTLDGRPGGIELPASVELGGARHRAGSQGRHRVERDEAGDARDRRSRSGTAVRERRRSDQGRHARAALYLARLT